MGFDGGVNALSNVFPDAYRTLYDYPESDRASDINREAIEPLFDSCLEEGFAPATKAALAERGVLPSNGVRPPLTSVEGKAIRAALDRADTVLS
jgi:4-hydroxy-tetrahydrodipicolinate synthase